MFPLFTRTLPETGDGLARVMSESVRRLFHTTSDPIAIKGERLPHLEAVRIQLDAATLRDDPPPPPQPGAEATPAFLADSLQIAGKQVSIGPAKADVDLTAQQVQFTQTRDARDEIVLLVQRAANGHLTIGASKADLEAGIAAIAAREAGRQGVTIENVQADLRQRGPRSVSADVRVKARKLFFSTVIHIAADLDIDSELNARLSNLACKGEGAIGSLACGFISPHLEKMNNRPFPLLGLSLGEIKLRDLRLTIGERLLAEAEFGV